MESWISFIVALFTTSIQWLASLEILGVSVIWLIIAFSLLGVMFRVLIFKS